VSADGPKPRPRGDYTVGYGCPPTHSRFKPGQSGNPRGRPKAGPIDLAAAIARELAQKVTLTENGQRRRVTKRDVIAKQLVNKAAAGDLRAVNFLQKWDTRSLLPWSNDVEAQGASRAADVPSGIDFSAMLTEDLELLMEASRILEGREERPPFPLPPTGPHKIKKL
jgi:hypothetical protein